MAAPLSKNWRKFPPLATQIDWSNPLTRNLGRVITPSSGLIDVVTRKISTVHGTVTRNPLGFTAASTSGNAINISDFSTSRYTCLYVAVANSVTAGTVAAIISRMDSSFRQNYVFLIKNGTTPRGGHLQLSNLQYIVAESSISAQVGSVFVGALTYDGSNIKAFTNGMLGATVAATDPTTTSLSSPVTDLLAADGPSRSVNYVGPGVMLAAIWNRALTDAEVAEVSENPWQLFRPQSAPVVFFAPATNVDALLANDLQSLSQLSSPAVGQKHALLANDLQSTSSVQTVTLGQKHVLLANDLESTSSVQTVPVGQKHVLLANDLESLSQLSSPTIGGGVGFVLLANDLESATQLSIPVLRQKRQVNYATSVTIASLNGVTFYHNGGKWYGY